MSEPRSIQARLELARVQEFVTVEQLALLLQVSQRTIRRRLPRFPQVIRDRQTIRIHRQSAIRSWVRQQTKTPHSTKVDVNAHS